MVLAGALATFGCMTNAKHLGTVFCVSLAVASFGCASSPHDEPATPADAPLAEPAPSAAATPDSERRMAGSEIPELEVPLLARSGSKLSGSARFVPVEGGVKVTLQVKDTPPGSHGAHIHQNADCSADDASSAGDHFNPQGHDHGRPGDAQRHLGDLGNLEVAADGTGSLEITIEGASLEIDDPNSFLGRSVIVHAKADDGGQPSGNAGGRIGCGAIVR